MQAVSDDKIQVRAYELWEQEGKPYGRAEEFWFRASTELAANDDAKVKKPKAAAKAKAEPKKAAAGAPKSKSVAETAAKPKKKTN